MKTLSLFVLTLSLAVQTHAGPAALLDKPLPKDPLKATIHRLSNGMTVYLSPNLEEPRVAAAVAVRAGARNDPQDSTGMAHYLEHMLFKGSSKLGTLDFAKENRHLERIRELYERRFRAKSAEERERIYKEIDKESVAAGRYAAPNEFDKVYTQLGFTKVNAGTGYDSTTFVCEFPRNRAETWARTETDRFSLPVFRLFQSELEAVYEEKNLYEDDAENVLDEAVMARVFRGHPYSVPILGTVEHLKNPSLRQMYGFFERNYVPGNMAVALSGDFDREEMLAVLEKNFGRIKAGSVPKTALPRPLRPKGAERLEVKYEAEEKVVVAWPTVPQDHPDYEPLVIMDMLMDNSAAGIINLELEQAQKVKDAGAYPRIQQDAGAWMVWAVTRKDQTIEQAEALLMETVAKLKNGDFTEDDIRSIITDFEVNEKQQLESNMSRTYKMARSFTSFEPWEKTVGSLERFKAVTKEDVLRVANKYLGEDRVVAYRRNAKPELPSIKKPGFTKIDLDPSRRSAFLEELLAMPAEPIEPKWLVQGRDYQATPMPQGELISTPNPFNDLFGLSFVFELGSDHLREVCAALDLLELSGAGDLTAESFKKKLYSLGTKLSYGCARDTLSVLLSGLDENLWPSLELMHQRFDDPNIAPGTLEKMVQVQLGAHQDNKKNPEYVFQALMGYGGRGKESDVLRELTDPELKALETRRLEKLLAKLFAYEHRTAYAGNRSPGEMAKLLDQDRRSFKSPPRRKNIAYLKPAAPRVVFTHRDMVQSWVGVFTGDEVFSPGPGNVVDYKFYSQYMGGMSGVIWQEARESRSLGYAAGGSYSEADHKGDENYLLGYVLTQADKTPEAADLLLDLFRDFPASQERFHQAAQAQEARSRTLRIGFRSIPGSVIIWDRLGYASDPRPERFQKTLAQTLAKTEAFAARFKTSPMTILVLGNKERVDLKALKKLGGFEEKTLEEIFPY